MNQKNIRYVYDMLLTFLSPINITPEENSKRILTGLIVIITCPVLLIYSIFHLFASHFLLAGVLFLTGIFVLAMILLGRKKADTTPFYRVGLAGIGLLLLYLLKISEVQPSRMFWAFIFPLEAMYLLGRKEGLLYSILYYFMVMILVSTLNLALPSGMHENWFKINYLFALFMVTLISYSLEVVRFQYQEETRRRQAALEAANRKWSQEIEKRKMMEQAAKNALLELKEMQSQLIQSAKLASIGELASGVAHELNQPLMVIRANVQLVMRTVKEGLAVSEDQLQYLTLAESNTKRMMNTINHLRTFSRDAKEKFVPVDINKIIEECLLMVGEQLRLHNIDFELKLMEDLPGISGNAIQVEQVFLNLITNARDAIESLGTEQERTGAINVVTGLFEGESKWVEILVKDTGKGISEKNLDSLFEPFFTTKEVGRGTGLGLSISYGIIKDHQGTIDVAETGVGGTTFRVRLPVPKHGKDTV
ncbi:MAG: hypothetical protein GY846_17575 [Deltaproteobacteria bacterium]|nr:hypothetical protein [Deltaproteobacteria bacterium]